jgi:hypothetical protein
VTKAEEQNMWARLVALEKVVAKLLQKRDVAGPLPTVEPHAVEPPRDRYGADVGRPDM